MRVFILFLFALIQITASANGENVLVPAEFSKFKEVCEQEKGKFKTLDPLSAHYKIVEPLTPKSIARCAIRTNDEDLANNKESKVGRITIFNLEKINEMISEMKCPGKVFISTMAEDTIKEGNPYASNWSLKVTHNLVIGCYTTRN